MPEDKLLEWFDRSAKPFLAKHAPDRLAALENDYKRLKRLREQPDRITACFLGNSGIGKSTLLNALAAGAEHVLPAGGIGPLTAQATEVRYSETAMFRVTYHQRKHLWKVAFALERRHENELRQSQAGSPGDSVDLGQLLDADDREEASAHAELAKRAEPASEAEGGQPSDAIEQITKQKLPDGFQTAEFFLDLHHDTVASGYDCGVFRHCVRSGQTWQSLSRAS